MIYDFNGKKLELANFVYKKRIIFWCSLDKTPTSRWGKWKLCENGSILQLQKLDGSDTNYLKVSDIWFALNSLGSVWIGNKIMRLGVIGNKIEFIKDLTERKIPVYDSYSNVQDKTNMQRKRNYADDKERKSIKKQKT